jgi:hypothetical protein
MVNPGSVLFVTLDSCRYDTFESASAPNLKAIGPLHRAMAPSHFTFGSHAAMFMGFTPGVAGRAEPYVNPKFAKLFKLDNAAHPGFATPLFDLRGASIIDGFRRQGYATIGTSSLGWFDPNSESGRVLSGSFERFWFTGSLHSLPRQLAWVNEQLAGASAPAFVFINLGETHVPYYFDGAPWDPGHNPCVPFGKDNDAAECRRRQKACVEFVDTQLAPLLQRFADEMIFVCADHGDCWGEDGLWEHGIHHAKTLEVPLIYRLPAARRAA